MPNIHYTTADLKRSVVDIRLDIVSMPFGSDTFDVVMASHILEHVENDRAALKEILRILRPGGFAFLQVPLDPARATTTEDPNIRLPQERLRAYLQEDHVRLYGRDYVDRVSECGFVVRSENPAAGLSTQEVTRFGLLPADDLIFGHKPCLSK
jgi:SAM-dependent methyltransferase